MALRLIVAMTITVLIGAPNKRTIEQMIRAPPGAKTHGSKPSRDATFAMIAQATHQKSGTMAVVNFWNNKPCRKDFMMNSDMQPAEAVSHKIHHNEISST